MPLSLQATIALDAVGQEAELTYTTRRVSKAAVPQVAIVVVPTQEAVYLNQTSLAIVFVEFAVQIVGIKRALSVALELSKEVAPSTAEVAPVHSSLAGGGGGTVV